MCIYAGYAGYEGKRWVKYDCQFRREALSYKDLNWSVINSCLYNETFTGRARAIPRCSYCGQDDHGEATCSHNPNRPMLAFFPNMSTWPGYMLPPNAGTSHLWRDLNEGRCKRQHCKYQHLCNKCHGNHPQVDCTYIPPVAGPNRSCSPHRSTPRGPPPGKRRWRMESEGHYVGRTTTSDGPSWWNSQMFEDYFTWERDQFKHPKGGRHANNSSQPRRLSKREDRSWTLHQKSRVPVLLPPQVPLWTQSNRESLGTVQAVLSSVFQLHPTEA